MAAFNGADSARGLIFGCSAKRTTLEKDGGGRPTSIERVSSVIAAGFDYTQVVDALVVAGVTRLAPYSE